jgi:hypothetical protein
MDFFKYEIKFKRLKNHQFAILAINVVFLSVMENVLITVMLNIVNNTACLPLACIDFQMSEKDECGH